MAKRKHSTSDSDAPSPKKAKQVATEPSEQSDTHSTTVAARVFAIPELMEMILLKVPVQDAIPAKLVCGQFNEVLTFSQAMQQPLFLRPPPSTPPLQWKIAGSRSQLHFMAAGGTNAQGQHQTHQVLNVVQPNLAVFGRSRNDLHTTAVCLFFNGHARLSLRKKLVDKINSSNTAEPWRSMMVSNPPVQRAWAAFEIAVGRVTICGKTDQVNNPSGVTFNELFAKAYELVNHGRPMNGSLWVESFAGPRWRDLIDMKLGELLAKVVEGEDAEPRWLYFEIRAPGVVVATEEQIGMVN